MASRSNRDVRYAKPTMASSAPTPPRSSITNSMRSAVSSRKPASGLARTIAQTVTDKNGNRSGPRPTVGQADPVTRRAALDAALRPGPPVKVAPPVQRPAATPEVGGIGGRARRQKIDELVDKMQ